MLYIQHGYGKSNKIEEALTLKSVNGIVFSPRNELPLKLYDYINNLHDHYPGVDVLLDPQIYFATVEVNTTLGQLPMYEYFPKTSIDKKILSVPKNIEALTEQCFTYQHSFGTTRYISPTIIINSFDSRWAQIAISLCNQSIEFIRTISTPENLLLTIAVDESAFSSLATVKEYLDEISLLEAKGFYIIINRLSPESPNLITPDILSNIMYFCYSLSVYNEFEVILGYTDLIGLPLYCSGVSTLCTGWYNTQRRFSISDYIPRSGGKQPNRRYLSSKLLNYILINPIMMQLILDKKVDPFLSKTEYDTLLLSNPAGDNWGPDISNQHNWSVLNQLLSELDSFHTVAEKVQCFKKKIQNAFDLYATITFDVNDAKSKPTHLSIWNTALDLFMDKVQQDG